MAVGLVLAALTLGAILVWTWAPVSSDDGLSAEKRELLEVERNFGDDSLDEPSSVELGPLLHELEELASQLQSYPPVATTPAGAGGIIEEALPWSGYLFENLWRQHRDDDVVSVHAGEFIYAEPPHGIVIVTIQSPGFGRILDSGFYLTPVNGGAVRVVDAIGDVLELQAEDGTKFLFDVGQRLYLSPDTLEVLPAAEFVPPVKTPPAAGPVPELPPSGGQQSASGGPSIMMVAIDADVNNTPANTATSFGSLERCNTLTVGGTLDVDVIIAWIPPADGSGGGLDGLQFSLLYDEATVKVTSSDANMLLAANSGSSLVPLGDTAPDTDGSFLIAGADFGSGTAEDGLGVLARITLEGVAQGVSSLTLADLTLVDSATNEYTVSFVLDAAVAVDTVCP